MPSISSTLVLLFKKITLLKRQIRWLTTGARSHFKKVKGYNLAVRFYIYVLAYGICFPLSDFNLYDSL